MGLDRNATVWQRLEAAIKAASEDAGIVLTRGMRESLTSMLHGYVLAERADAVSMAARNVEVGGRQ